MAVIDLSNIYFIFKNPETSLSGLLPERILDPVSRVTGIPGWY